MPTTTAAVRFLSGTGSPQGVVTAPYGSEYYQTDAASGNEIWDKATGTGNTGWRVRGSGNGTFSAPVTKTANYTATSSDHVIKVDASAGAVTITVPTAVGIPGKEYYVAKVDSSANNVTLATTSSQTINGLTTRSTNLQWDIMGIESDNANWIGLTPQDAAAEPYYYVKDYGASGTGSGGAAADQSGFSAAIAAANAATYGGIVYVEPGDYQVTGGFSLNRNVQIVGAGGASVLLTHTGTNICFSATANATGGQILQRKRFEGFRLVGNSGASAKGIAHGNAYGTLFKDVTVTDYTAGYGIETTNSVSYTEGTVFDGVHVRNCVRNYAFTISGTGTDSFSDTRFEHALSVSSASGQTGVWIDANATMYAGSMNIKLVCENAGARGLLVGANTRLLSNLYSIYCEISVAPSAGNGGIVTSANSLISGRGAIYPPLDNTAISDGGVAYHSIDPTTTIILDPAPGEILHTAAPGSDQYYLIGTLPDVSVSQLDKMWVELEGGGEWAATTLGRQCMAFGNYGGFSYQYSRTGGNPDYTYDALRVVAYRTGAVGTPVNIYARARSGQFASALVRAYGVGLRSNLSISSYGATRNVLGPPSTTTPSGTLVFDSYTYSPSAVIEAGDILSNTFKVATNPVINVTPVTVNANVTTAQNLMSYSVPAGQLNVVGKALRVRGAGIWSTVNTSQIPTLTLALTLGGVTIASFVTAAVTTGGQSNVPWNFDVLFSTVSTGTSATVETHGEFKTRLAAAAGPVNAYLDTNTAVSSAINLTTAATLQVTFQFSTNTATTGSNIATQRQLHALLTG